MDQNIIVTESCKNLRSLGRMSLRGKWGLAVGGTFILGLMTSVPTGIINIIFGGSDASSGFATLYSILVTGPLTLGYAMLGISIFRMMDASVAEVFYGFERFFKALGLYLLMNLFILLWAIPALIGFIAVVAALGTNFETMMEDGVMMVFLLIIMMVILCIPAYIAYYRYSMSFYIIADHPEVGPLEAIRRSKAMMKGNKWKLFCLQLSFIGWAILTLFTFFIGMLWLTPYIEVSTIAFYDIANGSLRAARPSGNMIQGESLNNSAADGISMDPITVYREDPAEPAAIEEPTVVREEEIPKMKEETNQTPIDKQ